MGYDAGDGHHFFNVPGSGSSDIVHVDDNTNVGVKGKWIFRLDGQDILNISVSQNNTGKDILRNENNLPSAGYQGMFRYRSV